MSPPSALSHGYAGPRAMTPGSAMVDSEDPSRVVYSACVAPAPPAQSPSVTPLDALLARVSDLERALRSSQGGDRWPYRFRDLCYFPEVVLPPNLHIPEFEKYNGKGCPIAHLKVYCSDLVHLQADDRLLIHLF